MNLSKKARRELSWIFIIVAGLSSAYFLILGDGGYRTLMQHDRELQGLSQENLELKRELGDYWERIDQLKNDPRALERLIRERDYARPNEVIVEIPE